MENIALFNSQIIAENAVLFGKVYRKYSEKAFEVFGRVAKVLILLCCVGSPSWARTSDPRINSQLARSNKSKAYAIFPNIKPLLFSPAFNDLAECHFRIFGKIQPFSITKILLKDKS